MDSISAGELEELVRDGMCLAGTPERPAIMLDRDDNILKFFYPRKRIFSTKKWWPPAARFAANAKKLTNRGVATVSINRVMHCKELDRHVISYKKLAGDDFRQQCAERGAAALAPLPAFIAHLHDQGIFFRSIHLGNLLLQSDRSIALLDVQDTRFSCFRLDPFRRARNISHLLNTRLDISQYLTYGVEQFVTEYLRHASLGRGIQRLLVWWFNIHSSNHRISVSPTLE